MFDPLGLNSLDPCAFLVFVQPTGLSVPISLISDSPSSELRTIGDPPPRPRNNYLIRNSSTLAMLIGHPSHRFEESLWYGLSASLTAFQQVTGADRDAEPLYFGTRVGIINSRSSFGP